MNAYLAAGLAMCAVLFVALLGTGYLAMYFNQRAKKDVLALLTPLAELTKGEADVDEAEVKGTWQGTIAQGRMAKAAAGTVTLWQTDLIDSAGGTGWNYVYSRPNPKKKSPDAEIDIVTESDTIREQLQRWTPEMLEPISPSATDWVQVEYSPERGGIRIARPMHGRNDIPGPDAYQRDLDFALQVGAENREMQARIGKETSA